VDTAIVIDFKKLRHEWKTFVLAIAATAGGAWQFAVASGASIPDLLAFVPPEYKSLSFFLLGMMFLILRKYSDDVRHEDDHV
jgi:hypothetical protein